MIVDTAPTLEFPAVARKKIVAAFNGGRMSSDSGVMLLTQVERHLGFAERLAALVPDARGPSQSAHARRVSVVCYDPKPQRQVAGQHRQE